MTTGKIASQAAHAALDTFLKCLELDKDRALLYRNGFQGIKVCLAVPNLDKLLKAEALAKETGLHTSLIHDLGYTCFEGQTTITVLGIGPAYKEEIKHITKRFQLLKDS